VDSAERKKETEGILDNSASQGSKYLTLFVALLGLSLVVNVLLSRKVSSLRSTVSQLMAHSSLKVGSRVPPILGRSVTGKDQVLNYADVQIPTVLYVFTPQCEWCKRNIDNLRVLIANSGSHYRMIGISLSKTDLNEYLEKEHLNLAVYSDIDDFTRKSYYFGDTPTTIIISPDARVLDVWHGAYEDSIRKEIEGKLNVSLPGCCKDIENHGNTSTSAPTVTHELVGPSVNSLAKR
jgi:peroxiredoxin